MGLPLRWLNFIPASDARARRRLLKLVAASVAVLLPLAVYAVDREDTELTGAGAQPVPANAMPIATSQEKPLLAKNETQDDNEARIAGIDTPPLEPRFAESVVWTEHGVIVWGGVNSTGRLRFGDGAILDLGSLTWRVIAPAPIAGRGDHTAVWTGSELLIFGGNTEPGIPAIDAAAYDPGADSWREIEPPPIKLLFGERSKVEAVWSRNRVVLWHIASDVTLEFDPSSGHWSRIGPTGIGGEDQAVFRSAGGHLVALSSTYGGSLNVSTLIDDRWIVGQPLTVKLDCCVSESSAINSGIVGDFLVVWDRPTGRTHVWEPDSQMFREIDSTVELRDCAGPARPVQIDQTVIAFGCNQGGYVLDPANLQWEAFTLQMDDYVALESGVWTGTHILALGGYGSPYAWSAGLIKLPIELG